MKRIKSPAKPVAGRYRNQNGSVTFRIAKGRIVGWRGTMQTTCGGYADLPTLTQNTYDFPATKVPRNGLVEAQSRGEQYSVRLQLKVVGSKVTQGRFNYNGPARCRAVKGFTAKRVGK